MNIPEDLLFNCSYIAGVVSEGLNHTDLVSALYVALTQQPEVREEFSACLRAGSEPPFVMDTINKISWVIAFGIMLLSAIVGNLIIMWLVFSNKRMRTTTNYFMVNLSISDLLMAVLNCAPNFVSMVISDWPYGGFYCTINNFVAYVTVSSGIFSLVAICIDRYFAIMLPRRRRLNRSRALGVIICIWIFSAFLASPAIMYSTSVTRVYAGGKSSDTCRIQWPDGSFPDSAMEYWYNIIFLVVTYGIPLVIMSSCYSVMGAKLWAGTSIGDYKGPQLESIRRKREAVRMFVVVMIVFAVCWLPYQTYFVFTHHHSHITSRNWVQHLYLFIYWLAMANSAVNPIIYLCMNAHFKRLFMEMPPARYMDNHCGCICIVPRFLCRILCRAVRNPLSRMLCSTLCTACGNCCCRLGLLPPADTFTSQMAPNTMTPPLTSRNYSSRSNISTKSTISGRSNHNFSNQSNRILKTEEIMHRGPFKKPSQASLASCKVEVHRMLPKSEDGFRIIPGSSTCEATKESIITLCGITLDESLGTRTSEETAV